MGQFDQRGRLMIERFGEPRGGAEVARMEPLWKRLGAPLFLHVRARKPDA